MYNTWGSRSEGEGQLIHSVRYFIKKWLYYKIHTHVWYTFTFVTE